MTEPLPTYAVRRAQGVELELEDGRTLVEGMSSWWAALHGFRHPALDAALKEQVDKMAHVMFGGLTHEPAATLGKMLVDMSMPGLDKVFLCDSGSVSVEVAMKMAVQFWFTTGKPAKSKFVTLRNGYHGDTFGAMSVCDPVNGMHSMFQGSLAKQVFVDTPSDCSEAAALEAAAGLRAVLEERHEELAAFIVEPVVQGAGGMRFYSPLLLKKARELCDEFDVLLIFDEIATGFGRTGTLFAAEQSTEQFKPMCTPCPAEVCTCRHPEQAQEPVSEPVVPDIICLGKALTGGYMTMGATMATDRISQGISGTGGVFMHGPTFMGNPLASAVAIASLSLLVNEPWGMRLAAVEDVLKAEMESLTDLAQVKQVRVLGGIGVCELHEPVKDMARVQNAFVEQGVWLRPFGKLLYTMPCFNSPALTDEHVVKITDAIRAVVTNDLAE
ncbi:Biotin biosynthesis bifunctional protein BioAB [Includes: Biotin synthase BioB [Durusdinium trenchii]|uniref:Biotin biosynthesis bifunctional protein BioAB n=1 Tax=Durusdinium trenchii TaxID=1381693 RepID=A0ABP0MEB0_9DINO